MTYYFIVPKAQLTQRMLNQTNQSQPDSVRRITRKGFLINSEHCVIETRDSVIPDSLLDYRPYTREALRQELAQSHWIQDV